MNTIPMLLQFNNQKRFEALQQIAVELIRSTNQRELLERIVEKATELLICDAGSLYLRNDPDHLAFEVALNRTRSFDFRRILIPVTSQGIACHVFNTGDMARVSDVYRLGEDCPYRFDNRVDDLIGYRTRSTLAVPLTDSRGERLGVLQLINRKRHIVEPWPVSDPEQLASMPAFSEEDATLLKSFAAIASASIEKFRLYQSIERLFEGFIHASVRAIESRDPVTSGHSERVALLSVDLAKAVHNCDRPEVRDIRFTASSLRALQYASLLHDFGKISVKENTLLKAKKLFPEEKERIRARLDKFSLTAEVLILRKLLGQLARQNRAPNEMDVAAVARDLEKHRKRIEECWNLVMELNEPSVLDEEKASHLEQLCQMRFPLTNGTEVSALEPGEIEILRIKRGSLTAAERREIENHVTSTYRFLSSIPWTRELQAIPEIAYAHHEKLDGSGYPRRLSADKIPLGSRIMTICDIYDALVAADRPYKKAVPVEKALAILEDEVKRGQLDGRLFRVFVESGVYDSDTFRQLNQPRKAA